VYVCGKAREGRHSDSRRHDSDCATASSRSGRWSPRWTGRVPIGIHTTCRCPWVGRQAGGSGDKPVPCRRTACRQAVPHPVGGLQVLPVTWMCHRVSRTVRDVLQGTQEGGTMRSRRWEYTGQPEAATCWPDCRLYCPKKWRGTFLTITSTAGLRPRKIASMKSSPR
jgi:hypothetical protein